MRSFWKKITPLHIEIAVHYMCTAAPFPRPSQAVTDFTNDLVNRGLLIPDAACENGYRTTEGLHAYVEALRSIPFPKKEMQPVWSFGAEWDKQLEKKEKPNPERTVVNWSGKPLGVCNNGGPAQCSCSQQRLRAGPHSPLVTINCPHFTVTDDKLVSEILAHEVQADFAEGQHPESFEANAKLADDVYKLATEPLATTEPFRTANYYHALMAALPGETDAQKIMRRTLENIAAIHDQEVNPSATASSVQRSVADYAKEGLRCAAKSHAADAEQAPLRTSAERKLPTTINALNRIADLSVPERGTFSVRSNLKQAITIAKNALLSVTTGKDEVPRSESTIHKHNSAMFTTLQQIAALGPNSGRKGQELAGACIKSLQTLDKLKWANEMRDGM
jgi:hypothetical protein